MMNSSNQVKQLRLQRAWSQEQLAELAGLSVRTIQRIENGDRPGLETLSALAAVFEVNVGEITGDAPAGHEQSLDLRIEEAKARVHQESRFFRSLSTAVVVCVLLVLLNRFTLRATTGLRGSPGSGGIAAGERLALVCFRRMDPQLASDAVAAAAAQIDLPRRRPRLR
jgi:transcriptional regulator with XRE-family HTH domain